MIMYYIAYEAGRKITDGEAASADEALANFAGQWVAAGNLGDETKYVDASGGTAMVVYVRNAREGIETSA